ncbi:hypothetical protein DHEL01_v211348 [Diaporthe helianthi]|uniref:Uncharacterized protein n=1 Tax=Diaporthe helianthi TaxID=158607 RepID=A0A2P5HJ33_DIAHE|nr:hypothetical protein DHEL01_v211348 [Diaporthe helianthi]
MVTYWRTESVMDNPLTRPSAHSLQRPQVFVKVEFGVSWSPQHAPRPRGFQYRSRAIRERAAHFPRHVPAPTTNYLAASSIQQFQQAQVPQFHEQRSLEPSLQPNQRPPQQARQQRQPQQQQQSRSRQVDFTPAPEQRQEELRPSRDERRSSGERHGRGRSAPPPLSDNNWDVVHPQLMADNAEGSSMAYATADRPVSDVWEDLPEVPTRFRLGEEGMPWESWELPVDWAPFMEPDPLLQPPSSHASPDPQHSQVVPQPSEEAPTSPTVVQIESPIESPRYQREDPERVRELEALGSAMMTVDNGFENQWWNSGERQPMATALYPPPTTRDHVREQLALGWATAHVSPDSSTTGGGGGGGAGPVSVLSGEPGTATLNNNAVVSPVSSYNGPDIQPGLSRSLSTRSDELWFTGGRYA